MKICPNCTTNNLDTSAYCVSCGAELTIPVKEEPARESRFPKDHITHREDHPASGMAKLAMTLGLISLFFVFFAVICAPLPGIMAIIIGNNELKKLRGERYSTNGETYCQIGIWSGWISTAIGILLIAIGGIATIWLVNWFIEAFTR
ncbi:MAG TPA: hypothetical protein PLH27_05705 [bacterium]|nr:hypothetical protein [bacterium]HMZ03523.1 hypothetical protein [bacterium]HNB08100.1 hypothetical protein [bacterium]HNB55821.1 hypothetical protein [bacterium]HNC48461.1 hypothetical protein [bacterium]